MGASRSTPFTRESNHSTHGSNRVSLMHALFGARLSSDGLMTGQLRSCAGTPWRNLPPLLADGRATMARKCRDEVDMCRAN
eukprot:9036453-Pyramimonas_sp.AAC.1